MRSTRAYRCSRALYFVCACLQVILATLGAGATENSLESVSQIILPVFVVMFCKFLDRFNLLSCPLFIARIQICEEGGFFYCTILTIPPPMISAGFDRWISYCHKIFHKMQTAYRRLLFPLLRTMCFALPNYSENLPACILSLRERTFFT